jgi:hypothetical protein
MRFLCFFVVIVVFVSLFGSCSKKAGNPFPSALFKTRNWHHQVQNIYTKYDTSFGHSDSTWSNTVADSDETFSVKLIDANNISFRGIKLKYQSGNDVMLFNYEMAPPSGSEILSYDVAKDSIVFRSDFYVTNGLPPTGDHQYETFWTY